VSFYRDHVLPRLVDRACNSAELREWRAGVTAGLSGTVVEIGFGSGLNVPHYPDTVELVHAVEPSGRARALARRRISDTSVPIEHLELEAETLPLPDDSCDGALSTFTLCTIPDVDAALAELRRVLRPGGQFHFLEHGRSPDPGVATWQQRLEPLQRRVAGGCHLTRCPADLVESAGFELVHVDSRYARGPRPWSWFTEGVAVNPQRG
jgi:ubiquinone/menaquinone biosynthesis C-methylase UbiE